MRKYYLTAELLIFKHRQQNISVSSTALLTTVTCPEVTLCCENLFDVCSCNWWWCRLLWALWGVQTCSSLIIVQSIAQYYRNVLLHQQLLPAVRNLFGNFFTFQQDNAPAYRVRKTVQLLTCETPDFIAPALWPANSSNPKLVDYQTWGKHGSRMHDIDRLKSRLTEEWEHFH